MSLRATWEEQERVVRFELTCEGQHATPLTIAYKGTWWPEIHAKAVRAGWLFKPHGGAMLGPCCSGKKNVE